MPWTPKDADRFKKGLTKKQKKKWAAIANAVLRRTGDDATAIRIANSRCVLEERAKASLSIIDTFDIGNKNMIPVKLPFRNKLKRKKKKKR